MRDPALLAAAMVRVIDSGQHTSVEVLKEMFEQYLGTGADFSAKIDIVKGMIHLVTSIPSEHA